MDGRLPFVFEASGSETHFTNGYDPHPTARRAKEHNDRSLVQMATGAGKTYTAVTAAYRLLKFGGFRRILFLVDRNNLAEQTIAEFQNYRTPDDGRRFRTSSYRGR